MEYVTNQDIKEVTKIVNPKFFQVVYKNVCFSKKALSISCSNDAEDILRDFFNDVMEWKERFAVLLLNKANKVIDVAKISDGGVSGTVVDMKVLMQNALLSNASAIIIAHNHPSGNLLPSQADKNITQKIKDAAQLLEIACLDHLILTEEDYYSFADNGIL